MTMGVGAARPLSPFGWLGIPIVITLVATVVLSTPMPFSFTLPQPVFPLALAFAWALIRPSVLPPFVLLFLGLFLDVFWGGPQGLWPLCLLATYAAVLAARRLIMGQDLIMQAVWYAGAVALAFLAGFTLMSMDAGEPISLVAVAWQYGWTLLLFPFARWLIVRYEDADVRFR